MAQPVLHQRENVVVLATLREQRPARPEARLFEPGRVEVEARQRPHHLRSWLRCESGHYSRNEERRSRVVGERRRSGRYLMKRFPAQPAVTQFAIQFRDFKWHDLLRGR